MAESILIFTHDYAISKPSDASGERTDRHKTKLSYQLLLPSDMVFTFEAHTKPHSITRRMMLALRG